jgi:hypothetical protein
MKQYLKISLSLVVMIIFSCLPSLVHAQGPGCDPLVDPLCVPIDGGLGFLIAAGVGYGIKKVRDSRKQQQAEENI